MKRAPGGSPAATSTRTAGCATDRRHSHGPTHRCFSVLSGSRNGLTRNRVAASGVHEHGVREPPPSTRGRRAILAALGEMRGWVGWKRKTEGVTDDRVQLIVVDAANVVGSRPDGWWRDRAGATRRLLAKLFKSRESLEQPAEMVVVLEGTAKAAVAGAANSEFDGLRVVLADGSGDDAIVDVVAAAAEEDSHRSITVVTSDRGLRDRVEALGAGTVGPRWLLDRIE